MKSAKVVAAFLLLALAVAEAAPPEYPGENANGPKKDVPQGPKIDKDVPQGPKNGKDVPQGPKNKGPYYPPPVDTSLPPPVYLPPTTIPPPPPPPPSSSASGKRVRCLNKNYQSCYFRQFTCPAACPESCQVDCVTCSPVCDCNRPGAVCQDPRFVGADGIAFYFHGKKDQDFCLVSDSNIISNIFCKYRKYML